MTAFEDREKRAAVSALVRRLENRGDADDEPFAAEFITALWGRGWRPLEVLRPHDWRNPPADPGTGEGKEAFERARSAMKARDSGQFPAVTTHPSDTNERNQ